VTAEDLLRVLADGESHSAEELARRFGVTAAAVGELVAQLEERWALDVRAVPGGGLRFARPIDWLDPAELRRAVAARAMPAGDTARWRLGTLEVATEVPSTNRVLLERAAPEPGVLDVCLAEYQTAGRGRRGRAWKTPLGCGVCLSVAWQFAAMPAQISALTLATGVVAARAVATVCGVRVELKWPNDLVWDERKLGGILVELKNAAHGGCHVVAGIGVNVSLPPERLASLSDWPRGAVDLATATGKAPPARPALVAELVTGLGSLFAHYAVAGFAAYRADWCAADYLRGRSVRLDDASGTLTGTAYGIDTEGALVIETAGGARRRFVSGDVSVRRTQ
jgi:BirA family biotin operon repressor/biotin-[acetyl-CoA-carboxylase] ligase